MKVTDRTILCQKLTSLQCFQPQHPVFEVFSKKGQQNTTNVRCETSDDYIYFFMFIAPVPLCRPRRLAKKRLPNKG